MTRKKQPQNEERRKRTPSSVPRERKRRSRLLPKRVPFRPRGGRRRNEGAIATVMEQQRVLTMMGGRTAMMAYRRPQQRTRLSAVSSTARVGSRSCRRSHTCGRRTCAASAGRRRDRAKWHGRRAIASRRCRATAATCASRSSFATTSRRRGWCSCWPTLWSVRCCSSPTGCTTGAGRRRTTH